MCDELSATFDVALKISESQFPPLISREKAREIGVTRFFVAEPCKRGHIAEQYVVNRKCVECQRLEMMDRYWKDPGRFRQKNKEWAQIPENRAKKAAATREYKKIKPTSYFNRKKQEREAGRPGPEICDLCEKPNRTKKPIYFDHCHASGKFRGWLCHRCNTVLGQCQDSVVLLRKLADYLEKSNAGSVQSEA